MFISFSMFLPEYIAACIEDGQNNVYKQCHT